MLLAVREDTLEIVMCGICVPHGVWKDTVYGYNSYGPFSCSVEYFFDAARKIYPHVFFEFV